MVNGQKPPVSLSFPANSRQQVELSLDESGSTVLGELQVYEPTAYTLWAPVWVTVPEAAKEALRERGGQAELSLCVPSAVPQDDDYVKVVGPGKDPSMIARQYGKVVGLLKLRRVKR